MSDRIALATEALAEWDVAADEVQPIDQGLINWTFRVRGPTESWALQRVSDIFEPAVCDDVDRVTRHLASKGLETPRVVRTRSDDCYAAVKGGIWRLLTWVTGTTHARVLDPSMAREAGRALGAFHLAMSDYREAFSARRLGVHDTAGHIARLASALDAQRDHRRYRDIEPIARDILNHRLPILRPTPERVVHGDPKFSNLVFHSESGRAKAWVDLDTVAPMPFPLEIGDALRSWCNPGGESEGTADFDLDRLDAAAEGYADVGGDLLLEAERAAFVVGAETIALELATRFCRDALEESYFAWSPERFASRSHHNLHRARIQLTLARTIAALRSEAEARVRRHL